MIGHARSSDLIHWDVLPPVTEPGDFGHLEVPQWVEIQSRYYLLFSAQASVHSALRCQQTGLRPVTGTHYLSAEDPLGPFCSSTDEFLVGDRIGSLYAGKLVPSPDGKWVLLASHLFAPDGTFVGELSDPFPVTVDCAGNLNANAQCPAASNFPDSVTSKCAMRPNY